MAWPASGARAADRNVFCGLALALAVFAPPDALNPWCRCRRRGCLAATIAGEGAAPAPQPPRAWLSTLPTATRSQLRLSPFWEEDYQELAGLIGEDHVLFGSDYPHPEGLADPRSYLQDLAHLPEEIVRKFMGGNLAALMGVAATV